MGKRIPIVQRILRLVDKNGPVPAHRPELGQCWLFIGRLNRDGYGIIKRGGRNGGNALAHVPMYDEVNEPLPDNWERDHLCRVRNCVRPTHLEGVPARINNLRSESPAAINARKTHCDSGHLLSDDNIYRATDGSRHCRICRAGWRREQTLRRNPDAGISMRLRTHCPEGHEYSPENTKITSQGGRVCRICSSKRATDWRKAHPA